MGELGAPVGLGGQVVVLRPGGTKAVAAPGVGGGLRQVGHVAIEYLVEQEVVDPARARGRQRLDGRRERLHNDGVVDDARGVLVQGHHVEPQRRELAVILRCVVPAGCAAGAPGESAAGT